MIYSTYMKKPVIYSALAVVFLFAAFMFWRMRATLPDGSAGKDSVGMYTESTGMMIASPEPEYVKRPDMLPVPFPPYEEDGLMMGGDEIRMGKIGYYPEIQPAYPNYAQSLSYSIVAKDPRTFSRNVRNFVTSIGGSIISSNISSSGRFITSYATLIFPKTRLGEVTDKITQESGEIVSEDTYTNDRTGAVEQAMAVVDEINLQKAFKEAELASAVKTTDKLQIQAAIAKLDRQLLQATQNVTIAKSELELVSLSLSISTSKQYFSGAYPFSPGEQFSQAWYSFTQFVSGILNGFIWIAVYSLLIIPAGWFAWMAVKSWRSTKKS